jgi:hypothetical protein
LDGPNSPIGVFQSTTHESGSEASDPKTRRSEKGASRGSSGGIMRAIEDIPSVMRTRARTFRPRLD